MHLVCSATLASYENKPLRLALQGHANARLAVFDRLLGHIDAAKNLVNFAHQKRSEVLYAKAHCKLFEINHFVESRVNYQKLGKSLNSLSKAEDGLGDKSLDYAFLLVFSLNFLAFTEISGAHLIQACTDGDLVLCNMHAQNLCKPGQVGKVCYGPGLSTHLRTQPKKQSATNGKKRVLCFFDNLKGKGNGGCSKF